MKSTYSDHSNVISWIILSLLSGLYQVQFNGELARMFNEIKLKLSFADGPTHYDHIT